jgi:secreted PhoX family phosphatase
VELIEGLNHHLVIKWEDPIGQGLRFGYDNDFIAFHRKKSGKEFLWVNHEQHSPFFVSGIKRGTPQTREQFLNEARNVGGSFVRVEKVGARWAYQQDPENFRLDGLTKIPFAWDQPIAGTRSAIGTLANCAGGTTPWGTILTCEENYDNFYGEVEFKDGVRKLLPKSDYRWNEHEPRPPEHYGWVVEIDPEKKSAQKLVALGRFKHEGATVVEDAFGRIVVYSGDDEEDQYIYKFISDSKNSLRKGELLVADTVNGRWLSLDLKKQPLLQKHFSNQTDVLIYARRAATLLGATPQNRPEDIAIDPKTGAIFIALTNSRTKLDPYGQIFKIEESPEKDSYTFKATSFLMGEKKNGFACPDNLCFDKNGNLWFTTDMSEKLIETGPYKGFGNNSLFVVPFSGPQAGSPIRVANSPVDAEFTGPCFSPDGETLFLSVQHPGASSSKKKITSHWPEGGDSIPRPGVIAIQGPFLKTLI